MVIMHSVFNLNTGIDKFEFKSAFDAFAIHLKEQDLLVSWCYMKHIENNGYNSNYPGMKFYLNMAFIDEEQSAKCWNYVESNQEPVKSMHLDVNRKTRDAMFFLFEDM